MRTIYDPRYQRVIDRLRAARRERALTQAEVAKALGWQRTILSNLETRERRADMLEIYLLCRLYGLRLSELEAILADRGTAP